MNTNDFNQPQTAGTPFSGIGTGLPLNASGAPRAAAGSFQLEQFKAAIISACHEIDPTFNPGANGWVRAFTPEQVNGLSLYTDRAQMEFKLAEIYARLDTLGSAQVVTPSMRPVRPAGGFTQRYIDDLNNYMALLSANMERLPLVMEAALLEEAVTHGAQKVIDAYHQALESMEGSAGGEGEIGNGEGGGDLGYGEGGREGSMAGQDAVGSAHPGAGQRDGEGDAP